MRDAARKILERLLVLRCRSGDGDAFEQLVAGHQGQLRYYIRRLLGGPAGEDDLLQDTWLAVWRSIGKLRDPAAFAPWLYRIARNKVYAQIRKQLKYQELTDQSQNLLSQEDPQDFSPDEAAKIHECLGKLRPEHREVLLLRFLEEMSYQDIATVIDKSVGTVRSRIHYAKHALRREMEDARDDR